MTNHLHIGDLPDGLNLGNCIAVDTEAMGLNNLRDRLCVVQISAGDGDAHVVHFPKAEYNAPNLKKLLADRNIRKLYHFARFDVAIIEQYLGVRAAPLYCTRTASRLVRTFTDKHGLKELCKDLLGVDISKQQQSSYWGAETLTNEQVDYAASDVLYLHRIKEKLDVMLERENRVLLAQELMDCIPARSSLDLAGWADVDIFAHS